MKYYRLRTDLLRYQIKTSKHQDSVTAEVPSLLQVATTDRVMPNNLLLTYMLTLGVSSRSSNSLDSGLDSMIHDRFMGENRQGDNLNTWEITKASPRPGLPFEIRNIRISRLSLAFVQIVP
jgi:hypothetical protein